MCFGGRALIKNSDERGEPWIRDFGLVRMNGLPQHTAQYTPLPSLMASPQPAPDTLPPSWPPECSQRRHGAQNDASAQNGVERGPACLSSCPRFRRTLAALRAPDPSPRRTSWSREPLPPEATTAVGGGHDASQGLRSQQRARPRGGAWIPPYPVPSPAARRGPPDTPLPMEGVLTHSYVLGQNPESWLACLLSRSSLSLRTKAAVCVMRIRALKPLCMRKRPGILLCMRRPQNARGSAPHPAKLPCTDRPGPDTLIHHRQSASPRDRSRLRKSATTNQCATSQCATPNTRPEAESGRHG